MNPTMRSLITALFVSTGVFAVAAPAVADEHGRREWREHHHEWRPYYSGPHVYVTAPPAYYAPPPTVYAPPAVVYNPPPPVVYAPAPAPAVNFVFPLRF